MSDGISSSLPPAGSISLAVCCALGSAMFSGLTLGLLTLDIVQLKLLINRPNKTPKDEKNAKYARKILPLRSDGNYLLVTLLTGNVAVNAGFSILLGDLTDGLVGFLISTVVITVFGEIIPQAACARYGLVVGGILAPVVYILEWILFPIVKPMAMVLNWVLGEDLGTIYDKKQLSALVDYHDNVVHVLTRDEARILKGGLEFALIKAEQAMTPIDQVYGIDVDSKLTYDTLSEAISSGYSRIPVFDRESSQCIVGLLFVKDLILVDYHAEVDVRTLLQFFGRGIYAVDDDTPLLELLKTFKQGQTHLAVVRSVSDEGERDPYYVHVGIITLEDVIEEILQDEINDEFELDKTQVHRRRRPRSQIKPLPASPNSPAGRPGGTTYYPRGAPRLSISSAAQSVSLERDRTLRTTREEIATACCGKCCVKTAGRGKRKSARSIQVTSSLHLRGEEACGKCVLGGKPSDDGGQLSQRARDRVGEHHEEERLTNVSSTRNRGDSQSSKKTVGGSVLFPCGLLWNRLGSRFHRGRRSGSARATVLSGGEEYVPVQKDILDKEDNNKADEDRELGVVSVVQPRDAEDTETPWKREGEQQNGTADDRTGHRGGQEIAGKSLPWWSWRGDTTSHAAKLLMRGKLKMFYENHHRSRTAEPLTAHEATAIASFLSNSTATFSPQILDTVYLAALLQSFYCIQPPHGSLLWRTSLTSKGRSSKLSQNDNLSCSRPFAVVVLYGRVRLYVGEEEIPCTMGPWSCLAMKGLGPPPPFLLAHPSPFASGTAYVSNSSQRSSLQRRPSAPPRLVVIPSAAQAPAASARSSGAERSGASSPLPLPSHQVAGGRDSAGPSHLCGDVPSAVGSCTGETACGSALALASHSSGSSPLSSTPLNCPKQCILSTLSPPVSSFVAAVDGPGIGKEGDSSSSRSLCGSKGESQESERTSPVHKERGSVQYCNTPLHNQTFPSDFYQSRLQPSPSHASQCPRSSSPSVSSSALESTDCTFAVSELPASSDLSPSSSSSSPCSAIPGAAVSSCKRTVADCHTLSVSVQDHCGTSVGFLDIEQATQTSALHDAFSLRTPESLSTRVSQFGSPSTDDLMSPVRNDVSPETSLATCLQQRLGPKAGRRLRLSQENSCARDDIPSGTFTPQLLETQGDAADTHIQSTPDVKLSGYSSQRSSWGSARCRSPKPVKGGEECVASDVVEDLGGSGDKEGQEDAVQESVECLAVAPSTFEADACKFHAIDALPSGHHSTHCFLESRRHRTGDGRNGDALCSVPALRTRGAFRKVRLGSSRHVQPEFGESGASADLNSDQDASYDQSRCSTGSEPEWKTTDAGWGRSPAARENGGFRPYWLPRWRRRKGPRYTPLNVGRRLGSSSCPAASPVVLQHVPAAVGWGCRPGRPEPCMAEADDISFSHERNECGSSFVCDRGVAQLQFRRSQSTGTLDKAGGSLPDVLRRRAEIAGESQENLDEDWMFGNSPASGRIACRCRREISRGGTRHLQTGSGRWRTNQRWPGGSCGPSKVTSGEAGDLETMRDPCLHAEEPSRPNVPIDLLDLSDDGCADGFPQSGQGRTRRFGLGSDAAQAGQRSCPKSPSGDRTGTREQQLPSEEEPGQLGDEGDGLRWKHSFASCSSLSLQSDEEDVEVYGHQGRSSDRLQLLEEVCVCGVSLPWTPEKHDEASSSDRGESPGTTGHVPASKMSSRGDDAARNSSGAPQASVHFKAETGEVEMQPRNTAQGTTNTPGALPLSPTERGGKGIEETRRGRVSALRLRSLGVKGQLPSGSSPAGVGRDTSPHELSHTAQTESRDTSRALSKEPRSAHPWQRQGRSVFQPGWKAQSLLDTKGQQEESFDHEPDRGEIGNGGSARHEYGQRGIEQEENQQSLEEQLTLQESRLLEVAKDLRSIARDVYTQQQQSTVGTQRWRREDEKTSGQQESSDEAAARQDSDEENWREKSGTARKLEEWAKGARAGDSAQSEEGEDSGRVAEVYQPDYTAITDGTCGLLLVPRWFYVLAVKAYLDVELHPPRPGISDPRSSCSRI